MRHILRLIVFPVAAALLAVPAMASPAAAHEPSLFLHSIGFGQVLNGHTDVIACDIAADGLGIRTRYIVNGSILFVRDTNGSEPGCGQAHTPSPATSFQVCSTQSLVIQECTAWVPA